MAEIFPEPWEARRREYLADTHKPAESYPSDKKRVPRRKSAAEAVTHRSKEIIVDACTLPPLGDYKVEELARQMRERNGTRFKRLIPREYELVRSNSKVEH